MSDLKSELLLRSIDEFFSDPKNAAQLRDVLKHRVPNLSLRSIEKYVTQHSKKNSTSFVKNIGGKIFRVHLEYKAALSGYSKKYFDPFCRSDRIEYRIPNTDEIVETTPAQLNFLRWTIKSSILPEVVKWKNNK